ncbi:hypothetical protein AVEN_82557-1 [Araneus ventricosus]|uniref:Uncharacterized protein n=1 Tax=Araneus ventricosus TaxID=182803 RepID=A0A4Y2VGU3_ARAVE|nr:hypothetical protein AVEN_82557-1 [Araneus ventricosus]
MVLSNDQRYIYDICLAISRGEYYSDLVLRKPGSVAHSRWITFAGRILRLYVVTEKPSDNLIILARSEKKTPWRTGKVAASGQEGARLETRFHQRSGMLDRRRLNPSRLPNVLPLVWCGRLQRECQPRRRSRHPITAQNCEIRPKIALTFLQNRTET